VKKTGDNGNAAATVRGRGRPSVAIPIADPGSTANALAALAAADVRERELAGEPAPDVEKQTDKQTEKQTGAVKPAAISPASPAAPPAPSSPAPAAAPGAPERKEIPLSGKKYRGMKAEQLKTALAIAENEKAELRAQLEKAKPAAAIAQAASDEVLQRACGETLSAGFGLAAMRFGEELRLVKEERETLGRVWAPVVAQLMRDHPELAAKYATIWAALSVTSGIVVEKVYTVRVKQQRAAAAAASPNK
jgi:hypothetical protein